MQIKFNTDKVRKHIASLNQDITDFAWNNGIKSNSLTCVLNSRYTPRLHIAYQIARAMKCSVEDLLIVTEDNQDPKP